MKNYLRKSMDKKVILGEMTWIEAKEMFKKAKVAIVVTGSTEQHGPHLPLQHDLLSALYVAKKAAEEIYPNAIVCVPTTIGTSPFHMDFPGTLSFRYEIFIEILLDVCRSIKHHGMKNVIFLNGHGGNGPALHIIARRAKEELGMKAIWMNYWDLVPRELCIKIFGDKISLPGHAGEYETSTALFTHPELVNLKAYEEFKDKSFPELEKAKKIASYNKFSKVDPSGYAMYNATMNVSEIATSGVLFEGGNPLNAKTEKGKEIIEKAIENLIEMIKDIF
ncbi:MAG: creatininase family protein [Nitrososphaerota archaeon]